ncbi:MAG: thioredoxin family protein [Campylobacterales bacterium]|nr:thioredoxin family protein [Campylobacterales bacterium]
MKKLFFGLLFLSLTLFASELKFYNSMDTSLIDAKKSEKNILLFLTQEGCPACEYMKDVVLEDEVVKNYLLNNFLVVEYDINKDGTPKGFKAYGTPTIYFLDSDKKEIAKKVVGARQKSDFLEILKKVK